MKDLFALNASDLCRPTTMIHIGDMVRLREGLVHRENIAVFRMAGITPTLTMLTGRCRSQFVPYDLRGVEQPDVVVHRLGHFCLPIGSKDPGGFRKKNLGFGKRLPISGIEFSGDLP